MTTPAAAIVITTTAPTVALVQLRHWLRPHYLKGGFDPNGDDVADLAAIAEQKKWLSP